MFKFKKSKIDIDEVYKSLRINIESSSNKEEIQTIAIISPSCKEGKSTVGSRLALSFAQSNKSTLLIDFNLRKPECHNIFNLKNEKGILDIFCKEKVLSEVIFKYNSNLDILLSGGITNNDTNIIESDKMDELLEEVKEKYDYIIIDTPQLDLYTDAEALGKKVDGALLVSSVNETKMESLLKTKKQLEKIQVNILGIILNKADKSFIN